MSNLFSQAPLMLANAISWEINTTGGGGISDSSNAETAISNSVFFWTLPQTATLPRCGHDRLKIFQTVWELLAVSDRADSRRWRLLLNSTPSYWNTLQPSFRRTVSRLQYVIDRKRFRPLTAEYLIYLSRTLLTIKAYLSDVLYSPC